ncbi:hypothetical protein [Mycoplasmopsis felis]|uniref:hypothetical protein n=1 Tax=Mycoplasmopsis felis TaxID=33923 RepID=UPI003A5C7C3C
MWNATNTSKNTLSALLTMGINEINHIYKHLSNKENVNFSLSYSMYWRCLLNLYIS